MKDFILHEDPNKSSEAADHEETDALGSKEPTRTSKSEMYFDEDADGIPVILQPESSVPPEFGSEAGLYSKFTQSRTVDTLTAMHNQARLNEEGPSEITETLNSSFLSVKEHFGDRDSYREEDFHSTGFKKIKCETMFIISVLMTTFSVEFSNTT
jgi:hypothetical protein